MCLIAVAHGVSARFPLIVAANRDELYARPTRRAHVWERGVASVAAKLGGVSAPDRADSPPGSLAPARDDRWVVGGRDLAHGGSWLAISGDGRFAAVTNLRGGERANAKSRGLLVRNFVLGDDDPLTYARGIAPHEYAGFHLIAGLAGGTFVHLSSETRELPRGIFGVSNGPPHARWEKIELAERRLRDAMHLHDADALAENLLEFLRTPTHRGPLDREVFIATDTYGTRSSTVIIASEDEIRFYEQNWSRGGVGEGDVVRFRELRIEN